MTDRIDRIVAGVAEHTRALLAADVSRWPAAREGLERIHGDLAATSPGHPALGRLRRFIDDLSLVYGIGERDNRADGNKRSFSRLSG